MKKHFYKALALAVAIFLSDGFNALEARAQGNLPEGAQPMIVMPHNMNVDYSARTLCLDITANVDYEVTSDAEWAVPVRKADGSVYLNLNVNATIESRQAVITVANKEKEIEQTLTINQGPNGTAENAPDITDPAYGIFADKVCSKLREGVTLSEIEQTENEFVRILAKQIYEGEYRTDYRVSSFPCLMNVNKLSEMWNTPGKLYDQRNGVTGISFAPGKHAVIVSGLPEGKTAKLTITAWYIGKVGGNFDGGDPQHREFTLQNGVNVIDYKLNADNYLGEYRNAYDGLGYITYDATENPESYPDIDVHFVHGKINGYLSPDLTNDEMHQMTANAVNTCMDVVGEKVHSVWTSKGLHDYCKATNGVSLGYRQWIHTIDSLIRWQHDLLGFTKYGRVPQNKTFAYVNYTYYMFQGGLGVSFHQNQESRVLSCKRITYSDSDAIWGLSHEWGHLHQMHPYFCWGGLGEISNNMNSYFNVMKMGYCWERGSFQPSVDIFTNDDYKMETGSTQRAGAYSMRNNYAYSSELKALCENMEKYGAAGSIPTVAENKLEAISISENDALPPLILLLNYTWFELKKKDFFPDLYEALRQTDEPNGSQIEKQGEVDKYELIASAQNDNKNNKLAQLKEKYPESCWVKDSYITEDNHGRWQNSAAYIFNFIRKTSRLSGYNLMPYFDQWGFLRTVALNIGDYGNKPILITKNMYDEFKVDMDALVESGELKAMDAQMLDKMMHMRHINIPTHKLFPTPEIPN